MVTLQINWPIVVDCRPFHRSWGCFVFQLRVFRFPKNRRYLVLFPFVVVSFLLVGLSDSALFSTICFAIIKCIISKTFHKGIWGGTRPQWRYSRFLVTAIIEGLVAFEIFDAGILLQKIRVQCGLSCVTFFVFISAFVWCHLLTHKWRWPWHDWHWSQACETVANLVLQLLTFWSLKMPKKARNALTL